MKSFYFRSLVVCSFLCTFLFVFSANAQNAGRLDASFGLSGFVYRSSAKLEDFVIQSDNKIIVIAQGGSIARFNINGTLDSTFGTNGIFTDPETFPCRGTTLQLQPDGKIVYGGGKDVQTQVHYCLGRLNTNGTFDTSFDMDGRVLTQMGIESQISSLNILPDGKILAAGWTSLQSTFNRDYAMIKYNSDGSLDTAFGTGGRAATDLGSNEFSYDASILPDGKIMLVGDFTDTLANQTMGAITRFNSNGTLDTTFGNNGKILRAGGANAKVDSVAIQTDGKIIIAGYALIPARYNPNGILDIEFNSPAWTTTSSVTLQSDGKIIIAGNDGILLTRYRSNGTLDPNFGRGGIVTATGGISGNLVFTTKVLISPNGKIVLGGSRPSNGFEIVLGRYVGNASPIFDFDGDGKTDISIFRVSNGQWWFLRSSDGGNNALQFGVSTDKIVPADYTGDGKTDVAIYRASEGGWYILRSEDLTYYAFPFGVSTDLPAPADYDGDAKADPAVFRASTGTWYILKSSGGLQITQFGSATSRPAVNDFDGDGKADIAVYNGSWWVLQSSDGQTVAQHLANGGNGNYSGDYTGDGKADVATFSNQFNAWYVRPSENPNATYSVVFGTSTDKLVPGDYDGDGKIDHAYFRLSTNTWHIRLSTGGTVQHIFGANGDIPTQSAFLP